MATAAPILETVDLEKTFGAVVAAGDINVKIHADEVIGVIGANGAGKTTFINMVTGYLKPSSGKILFEGREITGASPRKATRIGIRRSFQIVQLFAELTVMENMLIAASMQRSAPLTLLAPIHTPANEAAARQALADYGIDGHADQIVSTLAQGVRKLLDIAMALVSAPKLLLLDEPTSGVAAEEKFDLMDTVMAGVRKSGAACLFVEHDMEIVERYATRVLAFYDGRIIVDGPPAEALADPRVKQYVVGEEPHRHAAGGA